MFTAVTTKQHYHLPGAIKTSTLVFGTRGKAPGKQNLHAMRQSVRWCSAPASPRMACFVQLSPTHHLTLRWLPMLSWYDAWAIGQKSHCYIESDSAPTW